MGDLPDLDAGELRRMVDRFPRRPFCWMIAAVAVILHGLLVQGAWEGVLTITARGDNGVQLWGLFVIIDPLGYLVWMLCGVVLAASGVGDSYLYNFALPYVVFMAAGSVQWATVGYAVGRFSGRIIGMFSGRNGAAFEVVMRDGNGVNSDRGQVSGCRR